LPRGCVRILFPKITLFSYGAPNPLNPGLIRFSAAGTVMNEILGISLVYFIFLAIIVTAVLYLERYW
jgi:hypothetical protein